MSVSIWNQSTGLGYTPTATRIAFGGVSGLTDSADLAWDDTAKSLKLGRAGVVKLTATVLAGGGIEFDPAAGSNVDWFLTGAGEFVIWTGGTRVVKFLSSGVSEWQDGKDHSFGTTTGSKLGTVGGAAGQKLGFFGATPIVQPLRATGAGATVDNVITTLQLLGLCRQA